MWHYPVQNIHYVRYFGVISFVTSHKGVGNTERVGELHSVEPCQLNQVSNEHSGCKYSRRGVCINGPLDIGLDWPLFDNGLFLGTVPAPSS
jgi:hypothetical protein